MNVGCRNFRNGDIIKGLLIVSDPYKVAGDRNYRAMVQCTLCDRAPYEIVLSEIKRHVFNGCGCQKDRSNSTNWLSFQDWCVQNNQTHLLDAWDYDLNGKSPNKVSSCTDAHYYFKCPLGKHDSSSWQILSLTRRGKTKTICKQCNSFAQYAIDKFGDNVLDTYWDYRQNIADPWDISHASKLQIWVHCIDTTYHGSYLTTPAVFLKGVRCPYCNNKNVHSTDSFAAYCIQKYGEDFLNLYWSYEKNIVDPWKIAPQSNIDIYLNCEIHGLYKVSASNFYKHGTLCASCSREREQSKLQEKVEQYVSCFYQCSILHEYNCSIVARNPKTNRWLPYDNDVVFDDKYHLIIEVMGEQHYNANAGWNRKHAKKYNITPEQALADLQWRDEYKKQYALSKGYYYMALPYWTFDDNTYKSLIDTKIQEILSFSTQN